MCKVFAMTNVSQFKVNAKFISTVRNEVCRHADQDGFGYALLSKKGEIGGERTMRPLNFRPLIDPTGPKTTKQLPIVLDADNSFGKIDLTCPKTFIAHGRLSTNQVSLPNTHPFVSDEGDIALIHNGVVRDPTDGIKKNLVSSCDSEILLRYFERGGVEAIEKMVYGYYAVAAVDKNGLMHLFRDDRADLYIAWCKTVDSFIIATTAEIIRNVAKEMKWKIEHPEEILEKSYTVFDSNNILSHRAISPRTSEYAGTGYWNQDAWKGNGASVYNRGGGDNSGKKSTTTSETKDGSEGTRTRETGVTRVSSGGEGSTSEEFAGRSFMESDPSKEALPRYRQTAEAAASSGDSKNSGGTSSFETTDQTGEELQIHSLSDGSTVRTGVDEDMGRDERLDAIVHDIEDFRATRVGNGGI
jgi:hypothetical protein